MAQLVITATVTDPVTGQTATGSVTVEVTTPTLQNEEQT